MEPIVKIETTWITEDASGKVCDVCSEKIFSKTNVLYLIINDDKKIECAEVCQACYDLLKNNDAI